MRRALAAVLPHTLFLLLLVISWNRWIQPYVDTGRELTVPWRVSRGQALYRDIQFYHGPLAPYLGAAIDRVGGRSLGGRIGLAALLALLHLEALRRLAWQFLSPARASLAASLAVATAFFLRPGGWLFPFSFDTAMAVAGVTGALALVSTRARYRDAVAAGCLFAALLSRLEIGAAVTAIILWETRRERTRWRVLAVLPLVLSGVVYLGLSLGQPVGRLVRDGWLALLNPPEAFRNVYRAYAGLDRPGLRLTELALVAILLALVAALLATSSALTRRVSRGAQAIQPVTLLLVALAAGISLRPPDQLARLFWLLPPLVRVVPPLVVGAAATIVLARWRHRRDPMPGLSDAALLVAALFATRILLAAGYVGPYDAFFLPLPLVISTGLALRAADAASPAVGRALPSLTAGALTIFLTARAVAAWDDSRTRQWVRVDTPAGPILLPEPIATTTRLTLEDLARRIPAGGRLVGFPEGGFFNYVLGLENPLSIDQFFPGHAETAAEEQQIIRRIAAALPDAVVVSNVLAVGEERPAFGRDYFVELDRFLRTRFVPVACYGPGAGPNARVGDPQFFVTVRVPAAGR